MLNTSSLKRRQRETLSGDLKNSDFLLSSFILKILTYIRV